MNVLAAGRLSSGDLNAPADRAPADLLLGVRPENIRLADAGVPAEVQAIEYLGAETLVAANVAAESILARMPGRPPCRLGERVHLTWAPSSAHWFDASTGRRID
jgi:sn-glycerol 3-phosphate transport system ATP-binding protein